MYLEWEGIHKDLNGLKLRGFYAVGSLMERHESVQLVEGHLIGCSAANLRRVERLRKGKP